MTSWDVDDISDQEVALHYVLLADKGKDLEKKTPGTGITFVTGFYLGLLAQKHASSYGTFALRLLEKAMARSRKIPMEQVESEGIQMMKSIIKDTPFQED